VENLTWQSAIKPSRNLALLLWVLHVVSAAVLTMTNLAWIAKLILLMLIVASLIYHLLRDVGLRFPNSWREITLRENGVSIGLQGSSILSGKLSNTSVVFAYLVILVVKLEGHRFNTARVIFRDVLQPEAFRELCVYLKYSR
jgi:uncharacterized membrane protein AbrB (regulator of aidB expression)